MINTLIFMLLAVLGSSAMGYVYYLCEIDSPSEEDRRKNISVLSNDILNNNGNDAAWTDFHVKLQVHYIL